jgi:hypothetical protein
LQSCRYGALSLTRGRVCLPESQSAEISPLSVCTICILHVIKCTYMQHIQGLCQSRLSTADNALSLVAPATTAVSKRILSLPSLITTLCRPHGKHRLYSWWRRRFHSMVRFTEMCLPSHYLETDCIPPLFYCLLGAEGIENTASSIVAWPSNGLFTKNLPSQELIYQHAA